MSKFINKRNTKILILVTAFIWLLYDIPAAINEVPGDTESEVITENTVYPVVPAILGALPGHWTLPRLGPWKNWKGFFVLLGVAALLILWSVLAHFGILSSAHEWVGARPYAVVIVSYFLGGFLWGGLKRKADA